MPDSDSGLSMSTGPFDFDRAHAKTHFRSERSASLLERRSLERLRVQRLLGRIGLVDVVRARGARHRHDGRQPLDDYGFLGVLRFETARRVRGGTERYRDARGGRTASTVASHTANHVDARGLGDLRGRRRRGCLRRARASCCGSTSCCGSPRLRWWWRCRWWHRLAGRRRRCFGWHTCRRRIGDGRRSWRSLARCRRGRFAFRA